MQYKADAFLFDLDGTLINSHAAVERVWGQWAIDNNLDPKAVIAGCHGRRCSDTIFHFAPHLPQPEANNAFIDREAADTEGLFVIPGALEFLNSLPRNRWAIVTSCSEKLARVRMAFLKITTPDVLVLGDDVTRGKPDPQGYLLAAKKLGFAPERCIVFEDAPAGIEAGKRANMPVIMITSTHKNPEKGDACISDFRSLHLIEKSPFVFDI